MRALVGLVCLVVVQVVVVTSVAAGPRKVLVLPLDGNADPAVRAKLNTSVQKLARTLEGDVSVGDTTFEETAAAIGCVPTKPACAESVRATLGVDELVYGSATMSNGETTLVVRRVKAKQPPRVSRATVAAEDPPDRAETELSPLFDGTGGTVDDGSTGDGGQTGGTGGTGGTGDTGGIGVVEPVPVPEEPRYDNRKRNTGIIFASGGGLSLLIGLVLWGNKSDIQGDIDTAPTRTEADFANLQDKESRAFKYAMFGNVFVFGGLAVGGYGAWILYNDHKERQVTVTPQVTPTSAGVSLRGTW